MIGAKGLYSDTATKQAQQEADAIAAFLEALAVGQPPAMALEGAATEVDHAD